MSGICGFVSLSGEQLRPEILEPAIARLRRRGPDGVETWQCEDAALGHTLLATTPEALVEKLPLRHPETGCVITADARIDNREELFSLLGLTDAGRIIGDGELILRAYLRWGEACPEHLLGDFAFAIWDPRCRALFCARDHTGMRQLIYTHREHAFFAFATQPRALVALEDIPKRLNEARVLDLLEDDLESVDDEVTFFEGVFRLPPAHVLRVDPSGLVIRRYWQLEPGPVLRLESDAAYAEAFEEVFKNAVNSRLRCVGTPGAMLSGGMDSSAVTAVAADILARDGKGPLPTISATGPDRENRIETRLIEAAMAIKGISPNPINYSDIDALVPALRASLDDLEEPFDGRMTMIQAVYMVAARSGLKVILDGVSGDTTLHHGDVLGQAVRAGRYGKILSSARNEALSSGKTSTYWRALARAAWLTLAPDSMHRWRRNTILRSEIRKRHRVSLATPELIQQMDLTTRRERLAARYRNDELGLLGKRADDMIAGYVVVARERYDRVAATQGIEPRDPFLDIRLMTFSLALPSDQLLRGGSRKFILRNAMAGHVPDEIRWNQIRDHHGFDFKKSLFAARPELQSGHFSIPPNATRYVRDIQNLCRDPRGKLNLDLWVNIVSLIQWLRAADL